MKTTEDYLKFSLMLLNNGFHNESKLIKKETLDLMKLDHSLGLKYKKFAFGKKKGFGLGFEVVKEDGTKFGSKGTFGWGGMFGTFFRIDPKENMVIIYMTQSFETYKLKLADKFRSLVSGVSQECSLALAHAMVAEVPRHPPSHVLDNLPEIGG